MAALKGVIELAIESPSPEIRDEAGREVREMFVCPVCDWGGNSNRLPWSNDPRLLDIAPRAVLERLLIADLTHRMRHAFPGRFPISRQFTPKWLREETTFYKRLDEIQEEMEEEMERLNQGAAEAK
jgi:hypothetical protein